MQFADTGLPDTKTLRRAYEISWNFINKQYADPKNLEEDGHESIEDAYHVSILKAVSYMRMDGTGISEDAIAATMVQPAFTVHPEIASQVPESVRSILIELTGKMPLIISLAKKISRDGVSREKLLRFKEMTSLTSDEAAILKASYIPPVQYTRSELRRANSDKLLDLGLEIIGHYVPMLTVFNLLQDDRHPKLDSIIQDELNGLIEDYNNAQSLLGLDQPPNHDPDVFGF
ncbi:MAG: hypothetical protein GC137_03030 [Alphaproteobacteria bacterium]|nr:hypothetical protein [Alphaproteobacteria bacterium]